METVNHPNWYNSHPSGVEAIDVIEHLSFNLGNALKYLWRLGKKGDAIEDARKARFYLMRETEYVKGVIERDDSYPATLEALHQGLANVAATCAIVARKSEPNDPLRHVLTEIFNTNRFYDENLLAAIEHLNQFIEHKAGSAQ